MTNFELSVLFFLQLAVILVTCRVVAWLVTFIGQPPVISEIVAGVILGPGVFGALAPGVHAALFPRPSMTILYAAAQLGLVLYMFLVGVEFRAGLLTGRVRSMVAVSVAGIAVPLTLGVAIGTWIYSDRALFTASVSEGQAALFMGAAMSITAFPVLARLIQERGLSGAPVGSLALAAGSVDDGAAWCMLAVVLAGFGGDTGVAVLAFGGGVVYVLVCLLLLRPRLRALGRAVERSGAMSSTVLGGVLALVMLGAWCTDRLGIYAVFGAFVLGTAMPRGRFAEELKQKIGPLTSGLLVPLYFVYSGLNTRIGLVDSPALWALTLVILVAACAGKGLGCFTAAKLSGEPTRDAVAIGALMNARGLMELVLLNIVYERGLITQTLFSIMVIMAVVTTLMATPLLELALRRGSTGSVPRS